MVHKNDLCIITNPTKLYKKYKICKVNDTKKTNEHRGQINYMLQQTREIAAAEKQRRSATPKEPKHQQEAATSHTRSEQSQKTSKKLNCSRGIRQATQAEKNETNISSKHTITRVPYPFI
jgi:hypothetical protein